jgi:hypothetical protein
MNGKLGKYSWAVDFDGRTTVWVGPKEHCNTLCDELVACDPEEAILAVITRNEMFEKQGNELLKSFTVHCDP